MDDSGEFGVKHQTKSEKKQPRGKPFAKGTGPDRDPRIQSGPGRPPNEASIAYWIKQFAGMRPAEVAEAAHVQADRFAAFGDTPLTCAAIIAAQALLQLMNDPQASLLNVVLERSESDGAALPVTVIIGSSKWTPK